MNTNMYKSHQVKSLVNAKFGFPFTLLGILRMKRRKKREKKGKEGGLVSSWCPLNSLPQAFAKKFSRALKRAEIADSKAQHGIFLQLMQN